MTVEFNSYINHHEVKFFLNNTGEGTAPTNKARVQKDCNDSTSYFHSIRNENDKYG